MGVFPMGKCKDKCGISTALKILAITVAIAVVGGIIVAIIEQVQKGKDGDDDWEEIEGDEDDILYFSSDEDDEEDCTEQ